MSIYSRIQQAFKKLVHGSADPIAQYELEQQILAAHMKALMSAREFRIDGF